MATRKTARSSKVIQQVVLTFSVLLLFKASDATEDYDEDHKNVIYEYMLVCGDTALCEPSKFSFVNEKINITTNICPKCKCDRDCVRHKNCCPDVEYALSIPEPKCKSTILLNPDLRLLSALMVDSCNKMADPDLTENCTRSYTLHEGFQIPPVTSKHLFTTFVNKYCAICNDVRDFEPWGVNIKCSKFEDFNYLSSYEEIVDLARVRHCAIEYTHVSMSLQRCFPFELIEHSALIIDKCNTTGHWQAYDQGIEFACEKSGYLLTYKHYRNIFCLICNPGQRPTLNEVISTCNTTGAWNEYRRDLEIACEKHNNSSATFPFKNIYCYLCNRNNSKIDKYIDSLGTVAVDAKGKQQKPSLKYNVYISQHDIGYYGRILKSTEGKEDFPQQVKFKTKINNMTSLLLKHYSLTGNYTYCDGNLTSLKFLNESCLCDVDCFFKGYAKCCVEIVLQYPVSCYNDTFLSEQPAGDRLIISESFSLVDGCPYAETDIKIRQRCENPLNQDIFSMVPIHDDNNEIIYRNFDCFICNQKDIITEKDITLPSSYKYSPWKLVLSCTTDLNTDFHVVLGDIIKLAKERGCLVKMIPAKQNSEIVDSSREHCEHTRKLYSIDKCNVTGSWKVYDSDIVQACENTGPFLPEIYSRNVSMNIVYKNAFCSLCNPSLDMPLLPSLRNCNTSAERSLYGQNIIDACEHFPAVTNLFPYKNIFCKSCELNLSFPMNEAVRIRWKYIHIGNHPGDIPPEIVDMRDLFFTNRKQIIDIQQVDPMFGEVKDSQLYDSLAGKYRPLKCYPGKLLVKDKCMPLLTETRNLRYCLAVSLEGRFKENIPLTELMNLTKKVITQAVNATSIKFINFHLVSNSSCSLNFSDSNEIPVHLYVNTNFLIESQVKRLYTEEKLLGIRNMSIEFLNNTLQMKKDNNAFLVSSLLYKLNVKRHCILTFRSGYNYHSLENYRTTIVSDLLLCKQIELDKTEFKFDKSNFEIIVEHSTMNLQYDEFFITADGNVRVCVEDFKRIMLNSSPQTASLENPDMKTALGITNLTCTIVSLACLLLTFVTYSIFSILRSIPGINNMCLVFAMFFAQALFQFGLNQTSNKLVCEFIGVFSHFFWLSTFGCLSVCSFHMFSVFTDTIHARNMTENWKKTMLLYVIYAYGVPALIVTLNIIIIYLITDTSIGYGDWKCFVSHNISFYVTFVSPVLIVCFTNIYFFIKTALVIKSHPTVDSTRATRNDFLIYVKLFSITGISWLLLVLDTLFPLTAFSFIVIIFNAGQGVFIFFSFICNKRVFFLYKHIVRTPKKSSSFKSTSKSFSNVTEL